MATTSLKRPRDILAVLPQFLLVVFLHEFTYMTQEWVLTDNITSAETVVQMMFNSMPENLRTILF